MSNAHAQQYYFGSGTETNQGSGTIDSYDMIMQEPDALSDPVVETQAPQPGLNAPIAQDKQRGSS
jgi:hypothetical protein